MSVSFDAPTIDPIDVFATARARGESAVLWQLPSEDVALVGIGPERELTARGPARFAEIARQWRSLVESAIVVDGFSEAVFNEIHPGPGPLAMGGFAFGPGGSQGAWDGFGDGWVCLPGTVYGAVGERRWVTVNAVIDPETDVGDVAAHLEERVQFVTAHTLQPEVAASRSNDGAGYRASDGPFLATTDERPRESWMAAVERVAEAIREGRLEKAVMARSVHVELPDTFAIGAALRQLRSAYPDCYTFAVAREEGCFIGATPERIVHQERGTVKVACLAGSTGRGATKSEDDALGFALLKDSKNVEEHLVVLRSILAALDPVCSNIQSGVEPVLRKLANVQHLYTPVTAHVSGEHDVLELVSRIHPTPAIGGHPTDTALDLIAEEEEMHRGWYAGPVGWLNAAGDGEFAVGLRSGLLRDGKAHLFAGCGIMGDSDAQSEYDESVLKLRPMLTALEAGVK